MIPEPVKEWCKANGYGDVISSRPVGGGCINNGARLQTASGETFFLKGNRSAPAEMFAREAEGLHALSVQAGPRLPLPHLYGTDFLLMEDLSPATPRQNYWLEFGRCMATLHNHTSARFGFIHDNYIGSTPQPNTWNVDGFAFFAEQRLGYQGRLALQRGLLGKDEFKRIEHLCKRLPELVPKQPASLIHGDLWSGNAITDASGSPAIIDPAAHYGWAEAELAMTALFGGFPPSFYQAYNEVRPLESGYRERFPLYNLYHLLNHLNLFGSGYWGEVAGILRRYT